MKIFCLRWNRCRIHLDDKGLAFSQLQRENFATRRSLCPQAVSNSNVASTSSKLRFYSNPARGCNRASNNGLLFARVHWFFPRYDLLRSPLFWESPNKRRYILFDRIHQHITKYKHYVSSKISETSPHVSVCH